MTEPPDAKSAARLTMRAMRRFAPKHASAAERESSEWFFVCRKCGNARSYAEMGAIRYGAYSRGKVTFMKCPACGRWRCHLVERRREAASEAN